MTNNKQCIREKPDQTGQQARVPWRNSGRMKGRSDSSGRERTRTQPSSSLLRPGRNDGYTVGKNSLLKGIVVTASGCSIWWSWCV